MPRFSLNPLGALATPADARSPQEALSPRCAERQVAIPRRRRARDWAQRGDDLALSGSVVRWSSLRRRTAVALLDERGMPSFASSLAKSSPNASASASRFSAWSPCSAWLIAAFAAAQRERALRRERARDLERLLQQLAGLVDAVDEPDAQRLLRVDDPPGEDQLLRDAERRRRARGAASRPSRG